MHEPKLNHIKLANLFMSFAPEYYFEEGCYISEWMNDAADPALSVARARLPASNSTRWHRLHKITERYLILEGAGRAEVGDLSHTLRAGDSILIPPGERQRIHNTGNTDLVFLALCTPRFTTDCYEDVEPA